MIFFLIAASLFGRVSVADLRQREPVAVYKTDLAPKLVAQCIAETVVYTGTPTVIEGANDISVAALDNAYALALFTIKNGGVEVRRSVTTYRFKKKIAKCL